MLPPIGVSPHHLRRANPNKGGNEINFFWDLLTIELWKKGRLKKTTNFTILAILTPTSYPGNLSFSFCFFLLVSKNLPTNRLPNCLGAAASWQGVGSCQRLIFVGSNGLFLLVCVLVHLKRNGTQKQSRSKTLQNFAVSNTPIPQRLRTIKLYRRGSRILNSFRDLESGRVFPVASHLGFLRLGIWLCVP